MEESGLPPPVGACVRAAFPVRPRGAKGKGEGKGRGEYNVLLFPPAPPISPPISPRYDFMIIDRFLILSILEFTPFSALTGPGALECGSEGAATDRRVGEEFLLLALLFSLSPPFPLSVFFSPSPPPLDEDERRDHTNPSRLVSDDDFLHHITSHHIISYHIISYHIISYHIISYYRSSSKPPPPFPEECLYVSPNLTFAPNGQSVG